MAILRDPFWQFIGSLVTLGALLVSVAQYRQRTRKALAYKIFTTPLVWTEGDDRVQILYDGRVVDQVHLVTITVENIGNEPIHPSDFVKPLMIEVAGDSSILTAEILDTVPKGLLSPDDMTISQMSVVFSPILLNQRDAFVIKLLVSELSDDPKVTGRVIGVREVRRLSDSRPSTSMLFVSMCGWLVVLGASIYAIWLTERGDMQRAEVVGDFISWVVGFMLVFLFGLFVGRAFWGSPRRRHVPW